MFSQGQLSEALSISCVWGGGGSSEVGDKGHLNGSVG